MTTIESLESLPVKSHEVAEENAAKFAEWIASRGGLLIWESADLGDPKSVTTPALTPAGAMTPSPHWKFPSPSFRASLEQVTVFTTKVVSTFAVTLKQSQGRLVLSCASNLKVESELTRLRESGHSPFYRFGATGTSNGNPVHGLMFGQDTVEICIDGERIPLAEWIRRHAAAAIVA